MRHEDLAPYRQRYRPLIDRALAIDPNSGAAYFARAMWADAPFDARNADFKRGVALDPSNGRGLTAYAEFLDPDNFGWDTGAEGKSKLRRPKSKKPSACCSAPCRLIQCRRAPTSTPPRAALTKAAEPCSEHSMLSVLELDPNFVPALYQVGKFRWVLHDKLAEAVQILEHAIALDPGNPEPRHTTMAVYLDLGEEQAAREVAAGAPQVARDVHMRLMYAGDWHAAGLAAFDRAGSAFDYCANWLAAEALRDYALKSGELNRAMAFIDAQYEFRTIRRRTWIFAISEQRSRFRSCWPHKAMQQRREALRRAVLAWLEANAAKYAGSARRQWASALLLDGRRDAALDELAEVSAPATIMHWWYTLKYDPVWLPLHGDPRFQAIATDVQRHVDSERKAA